MPRTQTAQTLPWMQSALDLDQKCIHIDSDVHAKLSAIVAHFNQNSAATPLSLSDWLGAVIECRFDMMIASGDGTDAL